jgi:DNA-binding NarL/FixJ family response regulator
MTRILVIDDRADGRAQTKELLRAFPSSKIAGESASTDAAWQKIESTRIHLIILELGLSHGNAMEFIRKVRLLFPDIRMLIYTHQDENLYAERALRAGAHGYVNKPVSAAKMQDIVLTIMRGDLYVSEAIESKILHHLAGMEDVAENADPEQLLSNRELEIFVKIGEGFSSRDIASQLGLSIKTVETHRAHIKRKMHIESARELVQQANLWINRVHLART